MPNTTFNLYDKFLENDSEAVQNLGSATVTAHFSNAAPNPATHTVLGDISEIATGGGYTNGTGLAVPAATSSSIVSNAYEWKGSGKITMTASGTVAAFRYVILCFSAIANDPLWGYFDLGAALNLGAGAVFELDTTGIVLYRKRRAN